MKAGLIGLGAIGAMHFKNISEGKIDGLELAAFRRKAARARKISRRENLQVAFAKCFPIRMWTRS